MSGGSGGSGGSGSSEEAEVCVVRARTADGARLYVGSVWGREGAAGGCELHVLTEGRGWRGACSREALARLARERGETEREYAEATRRRLTTSAPEHEYELRPERDGSGAALFVWKARFPDGALLRCGAVRLQPGDEDVTLVDYLTQTNERLRLRLLDATRRSDALAADLSRCLADLAKFEDLKEEMERSLYAKFSQLLNAKKKRIEVLERTLQSLNVTPSDIGAEMDF